ncbi:DNA mismatch repair endonuclease MutL [Phycisphaerales bacterium ac7]
MHEPTGTTRREIRVLPALVVNQIAAGEVVERPASVVKELLDNAIDAGAGRITVELEQGGVELIRVTDDGSGIDPEQMELAVHPHATSKVRDAQDLDTIATMGFRGEALASIASVSRLSIRSRVAGSNEAALIEVEGDKVSPVRPDAGPVGTRVTVRNLFFNTPARRKFLRTVQTERTHCLDIVRSLAMSHPAIGFRVEVDGSTVLDLAPNQSARERAFAIIGPEHESEYVEVSADRFDDARGLALWGLAGLPVLARPTTKKQFVFLNGRPIRDKSIIHAVREAYRGLIEPGRHPAVLLMLEMSPGAVDVNVHPAKTEVRFRDQSLVHRVVYRAVQEALRGRDLTPARSSEGASGSSGPTARVSTRRWSRSRDGWRSSSSGSLRSRSLKGDLTFSSSSRRWTRTGWRWSRNASGLRHASVSCARRPSGCVPRLRPRPSLPIICDRRVFVMPRGRGAPGRSSGRPSAAGAQLVPRDPGRSGAGDHRSARAARAGDV